MMVVLSGEGPSDLGHCNNAQGQCQLPEFELGPMTLPVDKIITANRFASPLATHPESYIYISEQRLRHALDAA